MYYRSQGYPYQKNINLPPNYRGNAFDADSEEKTVAQEEPPETIYEENKTAEEPIEATYTEPSVQTSAEPDSETSLFRHNSFLGGKIGSEELLLLAVIFLISDSEGSDDILWLLILILFIK